MQTSMNKGLLLLALGSIIVATFSFFKLNQHRKTSKKQKEKKEKKDNNPSFESSTAHHEYKSAENSDADNENESKILYEKDINEQNPFDIVLVKPYFRTEIDNLHYYILLNLNKSKGYDGVTKIKFNRRSQNLADEDLVIDYAGSALLYLAVNNKKVKQQDVIFKNHKILIQKQLLVAGQNNIEIIYSNKYAFIGDGLACYFPLDETNKYSLKGQVIYSRNGVNKVSEIFPCFNIKNQCQVLLQVLHHNGFNAQSNNHKIESRIVSKKDYPQYEFLFHAHIKSLSYSSRLNNSSTTQNGSFKSNDEIVKTKSQFSVAKLNSIHDFFIFCSAVIEVRPLINLTNSTSSLNSSTEKALKDVLIRYFTKEQLAKKASSFLGILQSQIVEIFTKIEQYKKIHKIPLKYHCKIDIFFIDDLKAQGDFYSGAILLNESTIARGVIDRRLYFLLCRAFVGMGLLAKKQNNLLLLEGMFMLNQLTLSIFPQCYDYIFVKNKQYELIRNECLKIVQKLEEHKNENKMLYTEQEEKQIDMQYWIIDYYEKQVRYLVKNFDTLQSKLSVNVRNIIENLGHVSNEEYWTFFIARYPFIQFNVSQSLIKISLRHQGPPVGEAELKYCQENLIKSKYFLKFFTKQQIQNDLKRFIQLESHGIEKVLPFIKIKQSYLEFIPQKFQSYLYARENRTDAKKLYEQFKKYNEANNFHHSSALRREIKRIKLLARDSIKEERKDISCGLLGWKLLQKLKISPLHPQIYEIIYKLEAILKKNTCQQSIEKQAKVILDNLK